MLKAMLPLSTALGLFAAVPMSADKEPRTLSDALADTIETLEVLRGYRSADPKTVEQALVLEVTEPALGDSQARVERLESLSTDLERLHSHLELLQAGALPATAPVALADSPAVPTVGLAEGELERLVANSRKALLPTVSPEETAPTTPPPVVPGPPPPSATNTNDDGEPAASNTSAPADEDDTQVLDIAFAKARAAYFAGRYDTALAEFEAGPDDARHRYWRARCLEQLDRPKEALDLYQTVVDDPTAGDLATKAKGDADFLRWKLDFENGGAGQ